ncbi:MAG: DrmE family protein, partial [Saccharofermentanales bacterium]
MLEWNDYIDMLLKQECSFDDIRLSINGEITISGVPPIIKVSILMLDRMLATQGKYNILVFPEKSQTLLIFTLIKLLYDISEGKIEKSYNPESFIKGEKLKILNCVVAFNRIDVHNGKPYLWVDNAECSVGAPIEMMPLFQRTNTNRRLSKDSEFLIAKRAIREKTLNLPKADRQIAMLSDYKTHITSSTYYVAPIINTKEQLSRFKFNERDILDILLIGQVDYTGEIKNISPGQLSGIPSIVLASDLYAVCAAVQKSTLPQSLIIDVSNSNTINSQLDAMDELMHIGAPIMCVTDVADSFELQLLVERGFNIWRWDEDCITESLYDLSQISSIRKTRYCAIRKIEYIVTNGNEISDSLKKLYSHRIGINNQSARMISLFDTLFSAIFVALRAIMPTSSSERMLIQHNLSECDSIIEKEKAFITDDAYRDYKSVINNLKNIFTNGFNFTKHLALQEHLKAKNYLMIYILVPDKIDRNETQEYWQKWCFDNRLKTMVKVLCPSEYCSLNNTKYHVTIIVGWFNNTTMRKILFGFNTYKYVVLIYDYEKKWKDSHTARWSKTLNNSNNKIIVKKSLCKGLLDISVNRFHDDISTVSEPIQNELDEIELVLRENKYKHFVARSGQHSALETTEAIPVNFVGGYLALFKTTHKIVTATDIIINDVDKIVVKMPSQI